MSGSVNVYGKGFGAYYFDVDPLGSAASGLPVYERAGRKAAAGKYTIGVAGAYSLSGDLRKGFALLTGVQYGRMASRFAASPLVAIAGDKDQWIAGAGVAYQFCSGKAEIVRAAVRGRVWQYGEITVVDGSLKKKQ